MMVQGRLIMEYTHRNIFNAFLNTYSLKKIVLGKAYVNENRARVFGLMLLPVPKKDTTAHEMYKKHCIIFGLVVVMTKTINLYWLHVKN